MASTSSKALPYIAVGIVLFAMVMSAMGYEELISTLVAALPVLATVAGGGLINKHIEAGLEKYRTVAQDPAVKRLIEEIVTRSKGNSQ
jgi:hypothetical protein